MAATATNSVNPSDHLAAARERSSCSSLALGEFLYGGPERIEARRAVTELFENDPAFDRRDRPFMNHSQRYLASVAKCTAFI